ncbi:elongation factor Ts [Candidatus Roizmanbacteria bacterium]|nr:elongation factor Ts [Candidatus Roizmanbacteria bacterium]
MADYDKIKRLREETGVSISLCKKALEESGGDLEKAKKVLQRWGADRMAEKSARETAQGGIFSYIHHNRKVAAMVELKSETDFVSNNLEFVHLGQELAMQVASLNPKNVDELLKQEYIRDPSKKVEDLIKESVLKFGENIKVTRILHWELF